MAVPARLLLLASLAASLAAARPALADDPPAAPAADGARARGGDPEPAAADATTGDADAHREDATVTVRGRAPAPSRGASDFNLRVGELSRVPRQNAADLLKLAPGILLTNKGGDGHAEQVFLRGFDAREGQDIEFTAGGVPINEAGNLHGNGYADLHFIIPELVESLRVVEGPFDPRQGNFAVAGSAAYELGLARRGLTAKYTQGSFATQRMLLLWGPSRQSTHTFAGAELFDTDGFGQNRAAKRGSAMGQYEGRLGASGSFRLGAQAYTSQFRSAGVVRADDVASERIGFYDTYDRRQGGDSSRYSVWGDVETKTGDTLLKQQVFLIMRDMRLRENFTGFLLDVQKAQQNPHVQRGDLLDLHVDSQTLGARGSARWRTKALEQTQELELGYFARADRTASSQHRVEASTSAPYLTETDLDSRLGNVGLFGDAGLRPFGWLTFRGGARGDIFTYDVLDRCAQRSVRQPSASNPPGDASCLSQQDANDAGVRYREPHERRGTASIAVMPRGSILVGPFTGFTASLSLGKGIRSIDPVYINQDLPTPFASVEAGEIGVSYARGVGRDVELMARSIFFQTHVDRDLIFSETAGRATLANGTTRTGWVGAVRATGAWFDQAANVTLVRSTFDDTNLLVPYVPDVVVRSDSAVHHELPLRIGQDKLTGALAAGVTYVGRRPLPFGQRSDSIFTLDTSASLAWRSFEVALVATNLLDWRYRLSEFNFASDFRSAPQPTLVPGRHFTAGAPRGVFLTLTATLGGS
ncbi:MAG: TonB-dependent receptor plug domain-containing protein [Labilithrix sp.]|nr:TonB-dependent receptor plug domain-containing protein [Labilithrix sp.]